MPDPIVNDFLDMMPDTILVTPGVHDAFGEFTASGPAVPYPAHIYGRVLMVRSQVDGQLQASTVTAIVAGKDLNIKHEFTLPTRFEMTDPKPIAIAQHTDENGAHHETVYF